MTSAVERIEDIIRAWRLQKDALKIVRREVKRTSKAGGVLGLDLSNTGLEEANADIVDHDIRECQQSADDCAVLSMWTVFERLVFECLEAECEKMTCPPIEEFNQAVTKKVVNAVEYWKIDEALDLLKPLTGSDH